MPTGLNKPEVKIDMAEGKDQTVLTFYSGSEMLLFVPKSDFDKLKNKIEEHEKFFKEILFTDDGNKIVGVSRNGAIKAYNRNLYVARKLLHGKPYPEVKS